MGSYVYKYVYNDQIIYIGKNDTDLVSRLSAHGKPGDNIPEEGWNEINNSDIYYCKLANKIMSDVVESELIRKYKPKYNKAKMSEWAGLQFPELKWEKFINKEDFFCKEELDSEGNKKINELIELTKNILKEKDEELLYYKSRIMDLISHIDMLKYLNEEKDKLNFLIKNIDKMKDECGLILSYKELYFDINNYDKCKNDLDLYVINGNGKEEFVFPNLYNNVWDKNTVMVGIENSKECLLSSFSCSNFKLKINNHSYLKNDWMKSDCIKKLERINDHIRNIFYEEQKKCWSLSTRR